MLGKTFKGLTDEMLRWQTERFLGAGRRTRRLGGHGPARAGGGDRLRRGADQHPLPGRGGAAVRPGAALPRGQAAAEADTIDAVRAIHAGRVTG